MPKSRTVSTLQGTNPAYSLIVAANHENPKVLNIDGYCNGTANTQYWLQCFDSATVPANGTVPLRSLMLLGVDGFTFNKLDIGLDTASQDVPPNTGNLVFAISTTKDTLTIGTGTVTMTLNVDIEEYEIQTQYDTTVTDSGVTNKSIWATASGPNILTSLSVTNKEAGLRYVQIFSTDSPTNGDRPIPGCIWPIGATGGGSTLTQHVIQGDSSTATFSTLHIPETQTLNFSTAGFVPRSQTGPAQATPGVLTVGCKVVLSSTADTLTIVTGSGMDITAKYITL